MQLNPNEEVKLHIGSEHPVIQVTNGTVYISRAPGALTEGIQLSGGNPPLDLRGWGNFIYVYSDGVPSDVRLQGGQMVGVAQGYQNNNGGGGEYNYGGGDQGGGDTSSDPIDPASIAEPNSFQTYLVSNYANSLTLAYVDYVDSYTGESIALGDNTTQYSLTNFTTTSGPNITSVSPTSAGTWASEFENMEINFDGSGYWQGTFDLVSDDPNHGSHTVTAMGQVHSLDTLSINNYNYQPTATLRFAYGGDANTGLDGKELVKLDWQTDTPVSSTMDMQPGAQVWSMDPASGEDTQIPDAVVIAGSVIANNNIRLYVELPEGSVPAGHSLTVHSGEFIARDGSYRANPVYVSVGYPTVQYRTEMTVTRTSERDITLSGSFTGLTLAAPLTDNGNGAIYVGGTSAYEYGTLYETTGTSSHSITLNTDGTWSLSFVATDAVVNALETWEPTSYEMVDIGPWSGEPLVWDDGNGNSYAFYWEGSVPDAPQVDVAAWTNEQVTNFGGQYWYQAENLSHPIPSDGHFEITSVTLDGVAETPTVGDNYIRTTNQWASVRFTLPSGYVSGKPLVVDGYWKANDNSWQDAPVQWNFTT